MSLGVDAKARFSARSTGSKRWPGPRAGRLLCLVGMTALAGPLLAELVGTSAHAVSTRTWTLTSEQDFAAGEALGTAISSRGEVTVGMATERVELSAMLAFSSLALADGQVAVGSGEQGEVFLCCEGGKPRRLAKLDAVLVSALAAGPGKTVYAGTTPGGQVFAVDLASGATRLLAKLPADHVWALSYDRPRRLLYAATGSEGKLFAIDDQGRSSVLYDSGEKHLLSLLAASDGSLHVGTSDNAVLLHVRLEGSKPRARVSAVSDFGGNELRAIAEQGGALYVAVNSFEAPKSPPMPPPPRAPKGASIKAPAAPSSSAAVPSPSTPRPWERKAKGAIFRIDQAGRIEQRHALADGYYSALAVADGSVFAASGSSGRVYRLLPDGSPAPAGAAGRGELAPGLAPGGAAAGSMAAGGVVTAFDLPERQVLTMAFSGPTRVLGTGDGAAVYRILGRILGKPPGEPRFVSAVHDAEFLSRWGRVAWKGSGSLLVETRSGNTGKPDDTWSPWSRPEGASFGGHGEGRIQSPSGRYLQLRALFRPVAGGSPAGGSTLREVTTYYLPQNQPPRLTEVVAESADSKAAASAAGGSSGTASSAGHPAASRTPSLKLRWKVDNPDGDALIYRLHFRQDGETTWRPLGDPEPLTKAETDWNTESLADGMYIVRVSASDERANPLGTALEHQLESRPVLVDNHPPEVLDLRISLPTARGRARDGFSAISDLAFSIDGGEWQKLAPKDGILDDKVEPFAFRLPAGLAPGSHTLAVRAIDAAANIGVAQVGFQAAR